MRAGHTTSRRPCPNVRFFCRLGCAFLSGEGGEGPNCEANACCVRELRAFRWRGADFQASRKGSAPGKARVKP